MVRIFMRRTQRLSVSVANSDSDCTSDCEKPDGNQNENKECVTKPYIHLEPNKRRLSHEILRHQSHLNLCAPRAHRSDHTDICRFAHQKVKKFSSQTKIFIPLNISLLQTRKPFFTNSYFVRYISTFDLEKSSIYIYFSYSYIRIVFIKNCG